MIWWLRLSLCSASHSSSCWRRWRETGLDSQLFDLAVRAGQSLRARGWLLVTAESCTGGWVAEAVTMVSGSSEWFERGFVTYTDVAKQEMLGVQPATLKQHGAVSEPIVREMV